MISAPIAFAGLMGAAGVMLAAAAAHARPGLGLESASHLLLFHAAAVMACVALTEGGRLWRWPAIVAQLGWIAGALLFSADIALRAFTGHRFFPMAAPAGGTILIVAWISLSVAAVGESRR